jgi:hypothetical protein
MFSGQPVAEFSLGRMRAFSGRHLQQWAEGYQRPEVQIRLDPTAGIAARVPFSGRDQRLRWFRAVVSPDPWNVVFSVFEQN